MPFLLLYLPKDPYEYNRTNTPCPSPASFKSIQLDPTFAEHKNAKACLDLVYDGMMGLLYAVLKGHLTLAKRVCIVIDALDELDQGVCSNLLEALRQLMHSFSPSVCILVTSRPLRCLKEYLPDMETIGVDTKAPDIEMFVRARLVSSVRLAKTTEKYPTLQAEILRAVITLSNGMYVHIVSLESPAPHNANIRKVSLCTNVHGRTLEASHPRRCQAVFGALAKVTRPGLRTIISTSSEQG